MKLFRLTLCALLLSAAASCNRNTASSQEEAEAEPLHDIRYGIIADDYRLEENEVAQGETMGKILNRYGISAAVIDRLDKVAEKTFPLRNIRAGQKYVAFIHEDSLYAPHLDYLAYERSLSDYVVFEFMGDSVAVRTGEKEFTTRRSKKSAVITSSLWGSIMEKNLPYALAAELEDIYQWTVDFFGIQKGDSFTVIYDERFIDDTVSIGIGRIWAPASTMPARSTTPSRSARAGSSNTGRPTGPACASRCSRRRSSIRASARSSPMRASTRFTRSTVPTRASTTPPRRVRPYMPWPTAS